MPSHSRGRQAQWTTVLSKHVLMANPHYEVRLPSARRCACQQAPCACPPCPLDAMHPPCKRGHSCRLPQDDAQEQHLLTSEFFSKAFDATRVTRLRFVCIQPSPTCKSREHIAPENRRRARSAHPRGCADRSACSRRVPRRDELQRARYPMLHLPGVRAVGGAGAIAPGGAEGEGVAGMEERAGRAGEGER